MDDETFRRIIREHEKRIVARIGDEVAPREFFRLLLPGVSDEAMVAVVNQAVENVELERPDATPKDATFYGFMLGMSAGLAVGRSEFPLLYPDGQRRSNAPR